MEKLMSMEEFIKTSGASIGQVEVPEYVIKQITEVATYNLGELKDRKTNITDAIGAEADLLKELEEVWNELYKQSEGPEINPR